MLFDFCNVLRPGGEKNRPLSEVGGTALGHYVGLSVDLELGGDLKE